MADHLADITDEADALTNPMRIVEPLFTTDAHRNKRMRHLWTVTLPSLLDQLAAAVIPGEAYADPSEVTRATFASRPAARLDAVDRYLAIQVGAATWCVSVPLSLRETPASNIRALVGAAPTMVSDDQRQLAGDLHVWHTWAATVTGWEQPPHAPRAPCPICDKPGGLRIRLEKETGCCLTCGAAWDTTNIGLLTQHIRTYRAQSVATALAARAEAVEARHVHELQPRGWEPRPALPYLAW